MDIISNITIVDGSDHYSILWIIFGIMIGIALAIDFGLYSKIKSLIKRKQRSSQQQPFKHALIWTIIWISLATVFAGIIFLTVGHNKALLFVTGYIIEKSLSIDNMFIFLLIFSSLSYSSYVSTQGFDGGYTQCNSNENSPYFGRSVTTRKLSFRDICIWRIITVYCNTHAHTDEEKR